MTDKQNKIDPIREKYFKPLEVAEKYSDALFYFIATASVAILFVDQNKTPKLYDLAQTIFILIVLVYFALGQVVRLYFMRRAESARRKDFFSKAYGVSLSHNLTEAYYNNAETVPVKRMAAQLLENSLFSKAISLDMLRAERAKAAIYLIIWLIAALNRHSDLALAAAGAQAIFSEQIISRYVRTEWLRIRFEVTYDGVYQLLQGDMTTAISEAAVLELLSDYEAAKTNGGITLSSKSFERLNPRVSEEWECIKKALHL